MTSLPTVATIRISPSNKINNWVHFVIYNMLIENLYSFVKVKDNCYNTQYIMSFSI